MGFQNSILAGTNLVREAMQSEGFTAGANGWRIERDGDAEFNNVVIRGDIGGSFDGTIDSDDLQAESNNYNPGVSGWRIERDGDAEFNDVVVRGDISGTVDSADLDAESNNYNPGTAGWKINRDGSAEFQNITARGNITALDLECIAPLQAPASVRILTEEQLGGDGQATIHLDPGHSEAPAGTGRGDLPAQINTDYSGAANEPTRLELWAPSTKPSSGVGVPLNGCLIALRGAATNDAADEHQPTIVLNGIAYYSAIQLVNFGFKAPNAILLEAGSGGDVLAFCRTFLVRGNAVRDPHPSMTSLDPVDMDMTGGALYSMFRSSTNVKPASGGDAITGLTVMLDKERRYRIEAQTRARPTDPAAFQGLFGARIMVTDEDGSHNIAEDRAFLHPTSTSTLGTVMVQPVAHDYQVPNTQTNIMVQVAITAAFPGGGTEGNTEYRGSGDERFQHRIAIYDVGRAVT